MNKVSKALLGILCVSMFISCASRQGKTDWLMDDDALKDTIDLKVHEQIVGNTLVAEVKADNVTFSESLSKENILIHSTNNKENYDKISYDILKKNRVEEYIYSLNSDNSALTISIPNYDGTNQYDLVINSKGSSHTSFLEARLGDFTNDLNKESYVGLTKAQYIEGESNPTFVFEYKNNEVIGKETEIELGGSFKYLRVVNLAVYESVIVIQTTGNIIDDKDGIINFKQGFFKKEHPSFRVAIQDIDVAVDNSSFKYSEGVLKFDVETTGDHFCYDLEKEYFKIGNDFVPCDDYHVYEGRTKVQLSFKVDKGNLDEAIDYIRGKSIAIDEKALAYTRETVYTTVHAKEPTLYSSARVDLDNDEIDLDLYLSDGSFSLDLNKDDLSFTGELKDVKPSKVEGDKNAFSVSIPWESDDAFPVGEVSINENKVRTAWGTKCKRAKSGVASSSNNSSDDKSLVGQDRFEEEVIKYGKGGLTMAGKILDITLYLGALIGGAISFAEESKGAGISTMCTSLASLLAVFGIDGSKDSTEPSIMDVMDKLNRIDAKLDRMSTSLSRLGNEIKEGNSALEAGINRLEFQGYRTDWENFMLNYTSKLDGLDGRYAAAKNEYILNFLTKSNVAALQLPMIDEVNEKTNKTERVLAAKHPRMDTVSVDGAEIKETLVYTFNDMSTIFAKTRRECAMNGGAFSNDLEKYLTEDLDSYALKKVTDKYSGQNVESKQIEAEAKILGKQLHDCLFNDAHIWASREGKGISTEYITTFLGFCDAIMGKYVRSRLDVYVDMLSCLYNYSMELEYGINALKTSIRSNLLKFYNIGLTLLSESGYNSSVYLKAATDALEYIDNYAPSKSKTADGEYCYTLGCYIKSRALKGEVKLSYNNSGDNKASLVRDFVWVDAITNEQILLKNNSLLLTSTDIKKIERRKNNVKKLCDNTIVYEDGSVEVEGTQSGGDSNNNGSNNSNTKVIKYRATYEEIATLNTYNYLYKRGSISNAVKTNTNVKDITKVIFDYTGERPLTSKDFSVTCIVRGVGNSSHYFDINSKYKYQEDSGNYKEKKCWDGCEYAGSFYNLVTGAVTEEIIDRAAWYSEDHWYWVKKEKFAFKEHKTGSYAIALFKA